MKLPVIDFASPTVLARAWFGEARGDDKDHFYGAWNHGHSAAQAAQMAGRGVIRGQAAAKGGAAAQRVPMDQRQPQFYGLGRRNIGVKQVVADPNTAAKAESGAEDLLVKPVAGITRRSKDSSNQTLFGKVGDTEVMIKPQSGLTKKVWHPFRIPGQRDLENELAAQSVNKAMGGLVDAPEVAVRNVSGVGMSLVSEMRAGSPIAPISSAPREQIRDMAVFDTVIGNYDRKPGNYLIEESSTGNHLIAIDAGVAFPVQRALGASDMNAHTYLESQNNLALGPRQIQALQALKQNSAQVNAELDALVGSDAVDLMWERVDKMLTQRSLPTKASIDEDKWP